MNDPIQEADKLIQQKRYAEAWKLLSLYKGDAAVDMRLRWLHDNQQMLLQQNASQNPVLRWFLGLDWRVKLGLAFLGLCAGFIAFTMFGQAVGFLPDSIELTQTKVAQIVFTEQFLTENAPTPIDTAKPSATSSPEPSATDFPVPTITDTASATFTPSASSTITNTPLPRATNTPAPPTATYALYNAGDLCPIGSTETRLLELLADTEGVDFVESLCIQTVGGSIYFSADIIVYPGHNTVEIPQMLYEMVDAALISGFETTINMSDGQTATGYLWFTDGRSSIVPYTSGVIPPTPRPRFGELNNAQSLVVSAPTATPIPQPSALPSGTTYYANTGDVKVRACAQLSCEQLTVLQSGEAIQVIGETTGDSAYNSTLWYEVSWNGRQAYVHSELLSTQRIVPTSPPVNSSSAQNPPPVQQQWSCSGDLYNCGDLTCSEIASYMSACPGDPSDLDGNDDGRACESKCG